MIGRNRKYKTGTRWCIWRWTSVDSEYIVRLHLIKTPWFAICLHWILKPDPEPYLHDHPVSFLSIILRGGYTEWRHKVANSAFPGCSKSTGCLYNNFNGPITHRWFNWIRAARNDHHTIVDVKPKTLTLCFMGPKTREWGFHSPNGWIYWRDYYKAQRAEKENL